MKLVDEGVAPIRAVRHEISREFDHDVRRYMEYLRSEKSSTYASQAKAAQKSRLKGGAKPSKIRRAAVGG